MKNKKLSKAFHQSVLTREILDYLQPVAGRKYIDATIGGGGHTAEILAAGGQVLGIDWDEDAIFYCAKKFALKLKKEDDKQVAIGNKLVLVQGNFADLTKIAVKFGFLNVNGVLFDLGVSKHQLERPERGFSFIRAGPLDMRMNTDLSVTAKDLLRILSVKDLTRLFAKFSEKKAKAIAAEIVKVRKIQPIETTSQLADLVSGIVGLKGKIHPATKVFLALRAAVNFELENLKVCLPQAFSLLTLGGRLVVIAFHSAEDRIVKEFLKNTMSLSNLTDRPITPALEEVLANPQARSARLRVGEKIK